jgi:YVTN family beta-propeller protein
MCGRDTLSGLWRRFSGGASFLLIFLAVPTVVSAATPDFTITASPSSQTVPPGYTASYTIHLASVNGFAGPVNLIPSVFSDSQGLAVNARMNRVYVADWQSNSLTVIDTSTDRVIASIPVMQRPNGVSVNPITNKTYVTSSNSRGVSVVNDTTNTVDYTIDAPAGLAVAVNPVTNRIYIANTSTVTVIDASTRSIVGTLTVGFQPTGIGVNPVTNRIYVGSQNTNDVSVIDGSTDTVVATIPVTFSPGTFGVDVNPNTDRIYVTNLNGPVSVIDGSTNTVVANIPAVGTLTALVVNPVLSEVYVSDQFTYFGGPPPADKVAVLNATSNMQIASVAVGSVPSGIGLDQISGRIYVDNESSDTMSVIDSSTLTVVDTIILDPTISANPSTVTLSSGGTGTSTVMVTTYSNTRLGTYYFYVYGNSSAGIHSIILTLYVGDFALVPASTTLSVPRGSNASSAITISSLTGYWSVNVSAVITGQNLNVGVSPSTVSIGPGVAGQSTITIDLSSLNAIANYTLTITGTSGARSHSASILIRVVDFSISASSTRLTIQPGSSASLLVTASSLNGFSWTTSLVVASAPAGLSCSLNVTSIMLTASAYSQLTCSGVAGNYTVVVTGTSRPLVHSIVIPANVSQAPGGGGGGGGATPPAGAGSNLPPTYMVFFLVDAAVIAFSIIYFVRMKRRKPIQAEAATPVP